eukprot:357277-Chlamydomonas_euryale.AAC.8
MGHRLLCSRGPGVVRLEQHKAVPDYPEHHQRHPEGQDKQELREYGLAVGNCRLCCAPAAGLRVFVAM